MVQLPSGDLLTLCLLHETEARLVHLTACREEASKLVFMIDVSPKNIRSPGASPIYKRKTQITELKCFKGLGPFTPIVCMKCIFRPS